MQRLKWLATEYWSYAVDGLMSRDGDMRCWLKHATNMKPLTASSAQLPLPKMAPAVDMPLLVLGVTALGGTPGSKLGMPGSKAAGWPI